jgi:kynurenine formamidase
MSPRLLRTTAQLGLAVSLLLAPTASSPSHAQPREPADAAALERWLQELSNWGRWGKDDQRGTLNLITAEKRRAAAKLVREGITVSLAHPTLTGEAPDNTNPYGHELVLHGGGPGPWAVDRLSVLFHGYAHSHLDALCHMFHDGKMYNGFGRDQVTKEGCQKLSIEAIADGIFTRAILVDAPKLHGVEWLEPGTPIYPEDLDAWEKRAGVRVESGDVLLIRTGRWARRAAKGPWNVSASSAGLHASSVRWLKERGVAALGSDVASDVFPSGVEGESHPVHLLVLVGLGMPIFDNLDLEKLSEEAARLGRWDFLLTAAPLPLEGGTGSPLNPIAVF